MNKADKYVVNQILDRANHAYNHHYCTNTVFLDLHEQSLFEANKKELPAISYTITGAYEEAERRVILFYDNEMKAYIEEPFTTIRISYNNHKVKDLSHRDYLGAIMNLGISRDRIGDIICKEHEAYVIVLNDIVDYISQSLINVRNVTVEIDTVGLEYLKEYKPNFKAIKGTVSSMRLDNVIKVGFGISRKNASTFIQAGKVYVNSKLAIKASSLLNENDKVSIRGLGKIRLHTIGATSKKGRLFVEINRYI